jgi:hypothetical protein
MYVFLNPFFRGSACRATARVNRKCAVMLQMTADGERASERARGTEAIRRDYYMDKLQAGVLVFGT